jgi:hypothetical protein
MTCWSVAQIFSQRGLAIQEEVQRGGFGTYLPMMRCKRFVDGKESNTARPAMPGYMFVWGATGNFYSRDGSMIARVIGHVTDGEYDRVKADNAAGKHDEIAAGPVEVVQSDHKRRRRPRRSKRLRMRMAAASQQAA